MNKELMPLAWALKQARLRTGLRQLDVLQDSGIHVGRIEAGKANIQISTLIRLSELYQQPIWQLLPQ